MKNRITNNCACRKGSGEEKFLFEKNGYEIYECTKCGIRFSNLKDTRNHITSVYSDDYFFSGSGYSNYLEERKELYNSGIRYATIISKYALPGRLLDVGCAAGFYLQGFEKCGWKCVGLEPNETMAEYGRKELDQNIEIGHIESFETHDKFDLVNLIEVIGHFQDLKKAMLKVNALVKKEGLVLVESWDHRSLVARFFGKNWHEYSPPSVTNWFSQKSLIELFNSNGFDLVKTGRPYKNIKGAHGLEIIYRNTARFIFKKSLFDFLKFTIGKITLPYPPLDLKWYIFKKR
jgi:SAM-dependent methyltransferase